MVLWLVKPWEPSRTHLDILIRENPMRAEEGIKCAGAKPGRVWHARPAPRVAMLPGAARINVRKIARYAGRDCAPLQNASETNPWQQ